ncbi:IclR family transcriptional regulator [Paenibacillus thermoaerophilus]|uniref:IclR family transcriptional regulator n=1 Tax=Paenibacillus thermoaerophilus TaxID=1215385 RepID=A0ABW2V203_9BACL|nr:IclR family transcriptional regulator [Paenibacillus thermoaerophilus]TMV18271.1 IclR family transcriptional regulator [Paenibacillus thermoaerophilus]
MEDGKPTVRAVERALDLLLCFTEASELTLTELSAKVGLHKSTSYRLLASLEGKGFLQRDPATDKYRLGYRVWELSSNLSRDDDPGILLLPEMERLRDIVGETISLYVRDDLERVRIQAVQSNQAVRRVAPVGARLPLNVGASSKVLIAFEEEAVREKLLSELDWSHTDRDAFVRQLEEIRRIGYATSMEEREPGAAAVAAPIFNRGRRLVAALSVSGPVSRFFPDQVAGHAQAIMEAAKRMSMMLR